MSTLFRVGLGNDVHRLKPGGPLVLGGVIVPHHHGFDAHSDGDVVLHAAVDALLGAAGLGDIGEHFPDSDPRYKGMDSSVFVRRVVQMLEEAGWRIGNLDAIIMAQEPKLADHKPAIQANVASLLGLDADSVNIKAKTGERLGPVGEKEAIAAEVVCLIQRDV